MAEEKLIIDFWDVGQGDGTAIRLPDNKLVLIDLGPKGSPIIDWIADRRPTIHAAAITHNDEDHAGSLPSLVKMPGITIQTVYMLLDRDKNSPKFQNLWRPVREEEAKGRFSVHGLSTETVLWQGHDHCLKVVYPSFSENIAANRPNETSAIVSLLYKGETKIIWPGDAPMRIVADKCASTTPNLLHGPHHGGPVDRNHSQFRSWAEKLAPERVFISVGTNNPHSLPSKHYLNFHSGRGCQVICTELTKLCDNVHVSGRRPVLQTAALLGLRAARHGVPCRGCFRLTVERGSVTADAWDAVHVARVKTLRRPQCLVGR